MDRAEYLSGTSSGSIGGKLARGKGKARPEAPADFILGHAAALSMR